MAKTGDSSGGLAKLQALLLLSRKDMSGYDLMAAMGSLMGRKPSAGQIYPLLAKMKAQGYVQVHSAGARARKAYTITKKGMAALSEMLERTSSLVEAVLGEKLKACEHCGCVVYEGAYEKKIRGKVHYFCCSSCAGEKGGDECCGGGKHEK